MFLNSLIVTVELANKDHRYNSTSQLLTNNIVIMTSVVAPQMLLNKHFHFLLPPLSFHPLLINYSGYPFVEASNNGASGGSVRNRRARRAR